MALLRQKSLSFLPLLLVLRLHTLVSAERKPYIIYLGSHSHPPDANVYHYNQATEAHYDLLASSLGGKEIAERNMIYSYNKNINAFAANLEEEEAEEIAKRSEVISVIPSKFRELQTTHTWQMLGLVGMNGRVPHQSLWTKGFYGEDIIIANLDQGVWPESESFHDHGLGAVPRRWKGTCVDPSKEGVACNRKIIGSRFFNKGPELYLGKNMTALYRTPVDTGSHGSHTLSTAGGRFVANVNVNGVANGTASGGAPLSRLAAYKVCWPEIPGVTGTCFDVDNLAAFEAAIEDGVDVLSLSLGSDAAEYFDDSMAIGTFHAMMNGIAVVASAGNSGPMPGTVSNLAPWIFTVGASTIDRDLVSFAITGSGKQLEGRSASNGRLDPKKLYSIVKSEDVEDLTAPGFNKTVIGLCRKGSLDPKKVAGKILVCRRGLTSRFEKGEAAQATGAAGMILVNVDPTIDDVAADPHPLPAVHISYSNGVKLYAYLNSTSSPLGTISGPNTVLHVKPNPKMAMFSSRGPNTITPQILKPDITAPGVQVLAAYSQSPDAIATNPLNMSYGFMSGTSMACPHVAGAVALLKSARPEWSPAIIRSALMTTTRRRDNAGQQIMEEDGITAADPFAYGSGHIQPGRALDPGLVYDLQTKDYLDFLCAIGYNASMIGVFNDGPYSCPSPPLRLEDFNYPSFAVPELKGSTTMSRRLKNVGSIGTYKVDVRAPKGFKVSVRPEELSFETLGEEKMFTVTVSVDGFNDSGYQFGSLAWRNGKNIVRSPIAVSLGF